MKRRNIIILLTLLMSMAGAKALAFGTYINGVWYDFYGSEAWVVNPNIDEEGSYWDGHGQYSGEVTIPSSVYYQGTYYKVTTIDDAFYLCSGLTSLKIPSSIRFIYGWAFEYCNQLSKVIINDIASWCNVEFYYGNESNPLWYAKHLYQYDGWQYIEVKDLVIPQGVSTIKHDAFIGCRNFSSITISSDVTSIGERVFYGCDGLTTVIVKNTTPPTITSSSFSNIGNTTLYVPHGSKAAYQAADYWKDFGNIVDFAIDDVFTAKTKEGIDMSFKITGISPMEVQVGDETNAAISKTYAGKITIPSSVTMPGSDLSFTVSQIGANAFKNCNSITSVEIPVSISSIGESLFYGCSGLQEVVLPNSITRIPRSMNSGAVENYHVPGSVRWIGIYAINECDTVVIEDGNTSLSLGSRNADDGYFDGPLSGVKKLYVGCNTNCEANSYADQVFCGSNSSYTQLTGVTFGPLVTNAFTGYEFRCCDKVTNVTCLGKVPFTSPVLYQIPQTAVLYVPLGSKQQYETANGWKQFGDIREVTEVTINMDNTEIVYAGDYDLDFSNVEGLKAYVAGDFDMATSTINLIPAQLVSAGKGVILKGAKGTYTVPCANIESTAVDPLCGTISGRFIRNVEGENVNYAFDKDEHVFKPVDAVYGCLISRNGAYLSLPASSVSENGIITPVVSESTDITQLDNVVYIEPSEVISGNQAVLSVKMKNNVAIQTIQFDLYLPEGVTVAANEDGELITASKARINKFSYFNSTMQENGALRMLAQATPTNVPAGDGEICRVTVNVPESMAEGDYQIIFKDMLMVESDNTSHSPSPNVVQCKLTVLPYTPGDANNDGAINAIDFNMVGNYILGNHSQANFSFRAADFNNDGDVNAIDFNMVGNYILYGSSAPSSRATRQEETLDPQ